MNSPIQRHSAGTFLLSHYVELLTAAAILFVLQTGLLPFDFLQHPGKGATGKFFGATTTPYTIPDIVSNLMLYVPVGVFLFWSLIRALGRKGPALLLTIALAAVLSGGIEWMQAYSPTRVSSRIDFVSNVLGACVGVAMARYRVDELEDGWNTLPGGESVYFISNPGLGLWAHRDRFVD